jgi:aspartyl protease family protein
MTGDDSMRLVYALILLAFVASSLISHRLPIKQTFKYALAWMGIFAVGILIFSFKAEGLAIWSRVTTAISPEKPRVSGQEVRVDVGDDGHFRIEAQINRHPVNFLIDTGATNSTMSRRNATAAGVDISDAGFGVIVQTANGMTTMRRARAESIVIGPIKRDDQPLWISEDDDLNVLGMSFLTSLTSWRVEGKTMILTP